MSLKLMKERIRITGTTPREEMIRDGQNLLKEEIEHDVSFQPTMYFYDSIKEKDDKLANIRVQKRQNSTLIGNYMEFLSTYDNPIYVGDYIHDIKDNTYWLVYTSYNVDDIHYEGKLIQCNYLLKWQLSNGKIISRWCNIASASKYDVGENRTATLVLSTNTYSILIGYCGEGLELEEKRVFIDMLKDNPKKVFKITRNDDVLYNYGEMGSLLSFIADKTEFNKETDNQNLRICNYFSSNIVDDSSYNEKDEQIDDDVKDSNNEASVLSAKISGRDTLKVTIPRTFTATLFDNDGTEIEWNNEKYSWNVLTDFDIEFSCEKNKITIEIEDNNLIGNNFTLQIINNGNSICEKIINIIDIM